MTRMFKVDSEPIEPEDRKGSVLHLSGTIDAASVAQLEQAFTSALDGGCRYFVLDFSGIEYISSAGLRLLLKLRKAALSVGGSIKVAALRRDIRENVFDDLGFSQLIEVHGTVEEAVTSISPERS